MATLKAFKLTNGDLDVSNGRINIAEDSEAIQTSLLMRLDTRKDTYFLNLDFGLDRTSFTDKAVVDSEMDAEFKQGILNTPGVLELTAYRLELDTNRDLKLNATAKTIFSEEITVQL
jgi:hypothetical protein